MPKNFHQLYLSIPATKVIGSPMMGVQESNSDIKPYFSKSFVAFCMEFCLKYDFFSAKFLRYFPKR